MIYLWVVSFIWAFSFSLIKDQLSALPASYVSMVRMLFALLIFVPFFRPMAFRPKTQGILFFIGALQFGLMYVLYIEAFAYLLAHEVALFTVTTPLFVTLLYDLLEKKFNQASFLLVLLCVLGSVILKFDQVSRYDFWFGFLLLQSANFCFALGQVLYKRMFDHQKEDQKRAFVPMFFGAFCVTYVALVAQYDIGEIHPTSTQWMVLAYLGILASGLSFFWWNLGATKVHAGALAIMNNMKIPLGVFVALVFFAEPTHLIQLLLGTSLMLVALVWHEKRRKDQRARSL